MFKSNKILAVIPILILFLFLLSGFAYAEGNKVGTVTCDMLNVRESASTSAKIVAQLPQGTKVKVLESSSEWYKINYNDSTGWVFSEFLSVRDEAIGIGTINASNVNIRADHSTSSKVLTRLNKGDKVDVFERFGDWYKIQLPGEKFGWVHKDFLYVKETNVSRGIVEDTAPKVENPDKKDEAASDEAASKEEEKSTQQKIVEYAKKFLGVRYRYGGSSPSGFDCSGFVQYVFKHFDIKLERTSESQGEHGEKVSKDELKVADLVFFDTNGGLNRIEHVGIYIGGGKFIHASSGRSTRKVVISDLTEGFYKKTYMRARRYVK